MTEDDAIKAWKNVITRHRRRTNAEAVAFGFNEGLRARGLNDEGEWSMQNMVDDVIMFGHPRTLTKLLEAERAKTARLIETLKRLSLPPEVWDAVQGFERG